MKIKKNIYAIIACSLTIVFLLVFSGCSQRQASTSGAADKRTVTDMSGRVVTLPDNIERVATVGPVPVINSFIFAVGERDKIVNGLPDFARKPRWKYQTVFAPSIADKPVMQNANYEPNIEELLKAKPDVVFTMLPTIWSSANIETMEKNGTAVVSLDWREPEDVKKAVKLVADIFNKQSIADEYIQYFDNTIKKVNTIAAVIPTEKRVKVLYCNVKTFTQPHLIAEWWIQAAGGSSVTNDGRKAETMSFTLEQMLNWDPDVIIVTEPGGIDAVYQDERFSKIKAVANKKVYTAPVGAHVWSNRTIEQPLTVMWAAKTFYPEQFKDLDLEKEIRSFYEKFCNYKLSDQEVKDILREDS